MPAEKPGAEKGMITFALPQKRSSITGRVCHEPPPHPLLKQAKSGPVLQEQKLQILAKACICINAVMVIQCFKVSRRKHYTILVYNRIKRTTWKDQEPLGLEAQFRPLLGTNENLGTVAYLCGGIQVRVS